MNKQFNFKQFNFKVKYNTGLEKKAPLRNISERLRTPYRYFMNNQNIVEREIIYHSPDLWFNYVDKDDPVEKFILNLNFMFPDWAFIEIEMKNT